MWWVYALLSALFASLTAIFAKAGVKNIDSDVATGLRTVFIMVLVWGVIAARGQLHSIKVITGNTWTLLVLSGVATGLSWLFYFKAIQIGELTKVAPVDKLSLALTIIFSVVFLGESLTLKTIIGSTLIFAGVLFLIQ